MLERGADPNIVNKNGEGAFSAAAKIGKHSLLQLLLDFGADMDHCGGAALFWALKGKHLDIIQYLTRHGASLSYLHQWKAYYVNSRLRLWYRGSSCDTALTKECCT